MTDSGGNKGRGEEYHRNILNESIDGGGCAETWEALSAHRAEDDSNESQQLNIEQLLIETGCLQLDADEEDLELTSSFEEEWRSEMDELDESLHSEIADVLEVDGDVTIEDTKQSVDVLVDGQLLARWVSHPAMLADLTAHNIVSDRYDEWDELAPEERAQFIGGLRLYLDFCPDCGGEASFDTERKTSCCSEHDVATVSCDACGVRLFETVVTVEETA